MRETINQLAGLLFAVVGMTAVGFGLADAVKTHPITGETFALFGAAALFAVVARLTESKLKDDEENK